MFVMASISAPSGSGPVKVRNLSPSGALTEGAVLPAAKERVLMRRGGATVAGEVVWSEAGRAGLRFESQVTVAEWLPQGANRSAQQRVDAVVQEWKTGTADCLTSIASEIGQSEVSAAELTTLCEAIEALAADLAGDDAVVERHLSKLQTLDITAQVLRKLAGGR